MWLDFVSGCASDEFQKVEKFLGNKWLAFQKNPTSLPNIHISIHIWLKYLKCQVKPSKIPQVYKFRVTNIEAFDWMHNSNSLFHLLHLRCSWMKMDGSLDVFEKINGKFYGTC